MKKALVVFALAALAGCAGESRSSAGKRDPLSGNWVGVIDRDGWQRPLLVMIDSNSNGSYAGSWMSVETQPGVMLQKVRRGSDDVHLELASLVFDGHLRGRTIAGDVANRDGSAVGSFTLTRLDPEIPVNAGP